MQYIRQDRPRVHDRLTYKDVHVLEPRRNLNGNRDHQPSAPQYVGSTRQRQLARRPASRNQQSVQRDQIHTVNNAFVSFYFTNVPHDISYVALRQGFEVYGLMEDVYLARKRNVNGDVFSFVRYGKVKDVEKLLKALNNVWFGDWRVVAKVASFDRFGNSRGDHRERGEGDKMKDGAKKFEEKKVRLGREMEGRMSMRVLLRELKARRSSWLRWVMEEF